MGVRAEKRWELLIGSFAQCYLTPRGYVNGMSVPRAGESLLSDNIYRSLRVVYGSRLQRTRFCIIVEFR